MNKISKEQIQKLAFKIKIKLNDKQIKLLKKEFENVIFLRLKILNQFDLQNLIPLRYPDINSVSILREDNFCFEDIVGTNKNLIKNNRFKKEKSNLYLISNKK